MGVADCRHTHLTAEPSSLQVGACNSLEDLGLVPALLLTRPECCLACTQGWGSSSLCTDGEGHL